MQRSCVQAIIFVLLVIFHYSHSEFQRVCYFQSWARYRANIARFEVGDIDPDLCTHLVYAFGKLNRSTQTLTANEQAEEGAGGKYSQFNDLKSRNPALKTLLSIGGENDNSDGFLNITSSDEILQRFSTSAVQFLRSRGFDGLDVDWEYPNQATKNIFIKLLKSLKAAFNADTTSPKLVLTIAGPAGQWNIDPGYDVPEIAKYVDYAFLMTYDYTDTLAARAAFNSPLYSRNDVRFNPTLSTNWTVHYWNSLGMPFNKIVVGVTGVGRRLVLKNMTNTAPGSEVTGLVRKGTYYNIPAGLAYPEICDLLTNTSTKRTFDTQQKNPYLVNGDDWVGYEDKESLDIKLKWMIDLGVAGIMFWALDYDDFTGQMCNDGKYPLLNLVKSGSTAPASTTVGSTATATSSIAAATTIAAAVITATSSIPAAETTTATSPIQAAAATTATSPLPAAATTTTTSSIPAAATTTTATSSIPTTTRTTTKAVATTTKAQAATITTTQSSISTEKSSNCGSTTKTFRLFFAIFLICVFIM